jgi:Uma2 family endonuclease
METSMEAVLEVISEYDIHETVLEKPVLLRPSTVQEYLAMPEGAPYYQFIDGEVIYMAAPSIFHQDIVLNIGAALKEYLRKHSVGKVIIAPVDVHFDDKNYYEPDVVFVVQERLHIVTKNRVEGAPDLVVEVLSPSTGYYDLSRKKTVYEQEGVREYWLVYPEERRVEIYTNSDNGFQLHSQALRTGIVKSSALNGLELSIDAIFE